MATGETNSTAAGEAPSPPPPELGGAPAQGSAGPPGPDHVEALFTELGEQLEDERSRNRHREAVFLSVIVHLCVLILLILNPRLPSWLHFSSPPVLVNPQQLVRQQQLTYLVSPLQPPKPKHKVHSNVLSDRDRLYRHPQHRLLDSFAGPAAPALRRQPALRPVRPRPAIRPAPPPRMTAAAPKPAAPKPVEKAEGTAKTPGPGSANGGLRLENVPRTPQKAQLHIPIPGMSAESQLKQAIEAAARQQTQGAGQSVAEMGQLPSPQGLPSPPSPGGTGQVGDGVQILTNTEGVNFHSYLQQLLEVVRRNWYAVMPEMAYLGRKGRSVLVFKIDSQGHLVGLQLVSPSGTISFDQAALAAINASNPFPPLPSAFHGPFLGLRFFFFYNINPYQAQAAGAQ
ncbi:MAG: TonB family protein [Terriglobales bacterium]